jgi:hypothetical protein
MISRFFIGFGGAGHTVVRKSFRSPRACSTACWRDSINSANRSSLRYFFFFIFSPFQQRLDFFEKLNRVDHFERPEPLAKFFALDGDSRHQVEKIVVSAHYEIRFGGGSEVDVRLVPGSSE